MKPLAPGASDPAEKMLAAYRAQAAEWHGKSTTTYHEWVERHALKVFQARDNSGKPADLKVVVTIVGGEVEGKPERAEQDIRFSEAQHVTELLADGMIRSFSRSYTGIRGGGSDSLLPADELARIDQCIKRLPDDRGVLPPRNRRMLIEAADKPERRVRVFDIAKPPPEICELMRLLKTGLPAYVPRFQAYGSIDVCGHVDDGALAVTPQNEILFTGRHGRLQWWNPTTHEFIAEADVDQVKNIVLAPDKVHALAQTWKDTVLIDLPGRKSVRTFKDRPGVIDRPGAQFTKDGRHVLLDAFHEPVLILDTQSWEPVDHADDVPEHCTNIIPAPTAHRALVRVGNGSVTLWDTGRHRLVKRLRADSDMTMFAAFSPDESLVALCAHPWQYDGKDGTIVIYKSDRGEKARELHPFETREYGAIIQPLLWTPDGTYVLVAKQSSECISVFNTVTDKKRGELTGPIAINGMGLLTRSGELVAGDEFGKIGFWNLTAVMDNVREFEASLRVMP